MAYSFLRLTSFYSILLKKHYKTIDVNSLSYNDMLQALLKQDYAISDAYERSLQKLYQIETQIIVVNDINLQNKWAQEYDSTKNGLELVLEQIMFYRPNVIWLEDLSGVSTDFIHTLKKLPFVKVVFGHHCAPHNEHILKNMKSLDFIVSCSPLLTYQYKKMGIKNTFLMYHAFDNSILDKVKTTITKSINIVFTGSLMIGNELHNNRRELIKYLVDEKIDLKIYSDKTLYSKKQQLAFLVYKNLLKITGKNKTDLVSKKLHLGVDFQEQQFWHDLEPFLKPSLYGLDMYSVLNSSKICINNHGGVAGNYAANMRLFEATGVGTCLLTDAKENMNELFIPDVECVTYKNKEEAKEKINWLLNHPVDLAAIAKAGQERCLRDHTYDARAKQLNEIILNFL